MTSTHHRRTPLYAQRTFSQKLSDTFDFARRNARQLFSFIVVLLLPVCMVEALFLNSYIDVFEGEGSDWLITMGCTTMLSALGCVMVSAVVYGLMWLEQERHGTLEGLTLNEFKPTLMVCLRRSVVLLAVYALIGVVAFVLLVLSVSTSALIFLMLLFAMMCAVLPLLMIAPAYLLGGYDILGSLQQGLRYGWHTWGGIFATMFVMGLLVNVASSLIGMPFTICEILRMIFVADDGATEALAFTASPWFTVLAYLLAVVYLLVNYLGYTLVAIALGYQYGHAAEKLDGASVAADMENFENLAEDQQERALFDEIDDFERL